MYPAVIIFQLQVERKDRGRCGPRLRRHHHDTNSSLSFALRLDLGASVGRLSDLDLEEPGLNSAALAGWRNGAYGQKADAATAPSFDSAT